MAKKREVILQETLTSSEQWDDAMSKSALYVVDVYQKWCGPCKAITGLLKRVKNELGDTLLHFATCGELVAVVNGCNAPLVQKTIEDSLKYEHKVQAGEAERKVIKDMGTQDEEEESAEGSEDEEEEEVATAGIPKQITVALIKPDVVENGQVDEILAKIAEAGIEVLANEPRTLEAEEAKIFYQNKSEEEYFDQLISYVTSGPCHVLVLTKSGSGEGVVEAWRDIIGPFDAAVAKEENPDSLRAIYGKDATSNALHGSSSKEDASRELGFFFPDFETPTYRAQSSMSRRSRASARSTKSAKAEKRLQRTLAIVRPDALKHHKDEIMSKIHEAGFEIAMQKEITLSKEQAEAFYKDHAGQDYFDALVSQMTSGPVMALCLAHEDAVAKWRDLLGPKVVEEAKESAPDSLRAQFHVEDAPVNMLHGSDSVDAAEMELPQLFQVEQTMAVIKPDAISDKDQIMAKLKEAGFMISLQKDVNLSEDIAKQIYKSKEGSDFYDDLVNHMTSGPTLMMVLSAENAVDKLREIVGPTDPEEAKTSAPNSLRALFAKSIMENAVHSPSTKESAKEKINIVFGDLEFNWDGSVKSDVNVQTSDDESASKAGESADNEQSDDGQPKNTNESADAEVDAEEAQQEEEGKADEEEKPEEKENDESAAEAEKTENEETGSVKSGSSSSSSDSDSGNGEKTDKNNDSDNEDKKSVGPSDSATPTKGGDTPTEGRATPIKGGDTPTQERATPIKEGDTPTQGGETPTRGSDTPAVDNSKSTDEGATPIQENPSSNRESAAATPTKEGFSGDKSDIQPEVEPTNKSDSETDNNTQNIKADISKTPEKSRPGSTSSKKSN